MESGDGCTDTCLIEDQWICVPGESPPATLEAMGPSICTFLCISGNNERHLDPVTGNLQWQQKPCDDGNVNSNGDGCTILCNVEKGWICTGGTAT